MIIKVQQIQSIKFYLAIIVNLCLIGCLDKPKDSLKTIKVHTPKVDITSQVINAKYLKLINHKGLVYYNEQPFTGISQRFYDDTILAEEIYYFNGIKHGVFKKWFPDGLLSFESIYTNGKQNGITKSWWRNGKLRSESNFVNGIAHGVQRQWYITGERFKELHLANGREEGIQRTWRKNGKLYNNYEAKNGRIFGLKRANLCYSLENETPIVNSLITQRNDNEDVSSNH